MKQGAIFDMDGLLFDTEIVYRKGWSVIADEFGVERKPELADACSGTSGELTVCMVHKYHPTVDAEAYIRRVVQYVHDEAAKNLPVMEGVHEILQYFHEHGVRIATASSSTVEQIEANLVKSGLRDYFDTVVGGDLVTNGKPAPDIFLLAAERIGVSPADCYVFEDGYNGLRGAAAAGCAPVMIPDTMPPTDEMRAICTGIYPTLSAVLEEVRAGRL